MLIGFSLSACGGGESGPPVSNPPSVSAPSVGAPQTCSLEDQQSWLRSHVRQDYLWNARTPDLAPTGFTDLRAYFNALLFQGDSVIPQDRFSGFGPTPEYDLYYEQGRTLGFGVAVAGQEVLGQPTQPLWVRYVEPNSPAAAADVRRGDRVLSLNGVPTPQVIAAEDFSALVAQAEGNVLTLEVQREGQLIQKRIVAGVYDLTPVQPAKVINTANGQRVGYLYVHAFLAQSESLMDRAFETLVSQGITELVVDLRYNTGGFVSVGERLASFVGGQGKGGLVYTDLAYNSNNRRLNTRYRLTDRMGWPGLRRVYVLAGQRTCSASEQFVNGLRGVGLEVIQVGDTTCGKPVGFNARAHCGNTFSIVMFESLNAQGVGGYYNGLAPNCPAEDDWSKPLGDPTEGLMSVALSHAASGQCPVKLAQRKQGSPQFRAWPWVEPMPPPAMLR